MPERLVEPAASEAYKKETEAKFGRNVEIDAIFVRHGEKETSTSNAETSLTSEGEQMARDFGAGLEEKDAIKPFSSDTDRTIDTAKLATAASPTDKKMALRIRGELGMVYDKKGPFVDELFKRKAEILGKDFKQVGLEEQKRRMEEYDAFSHDFYLQNWDKRPDPGTYSPVEEAAMVARRVDTFIRMADRLHSGSQVDLLSATHDYVLAAFLKEVMIREQGGTSVRGYESVKDIGGPLGYTESFNVKIRTNESGGKAVKLVFRGKDYDMDMDRLQELVEIGKNLSEQEKAKDETQD